MIKDRRSTFLNVRKISYNDHLSLSNCLGPKKLHYWCLSPGFAMRQLCMQNTRSILLTSGTLSPIDSFKTQLAM
jgi:Rad3-related DNA helicase